MYAYTYTDITLCMSTEAAELVEAEAHLLQGALYQVLRLAAGYYYP